MLCTCTSVPESFSEVQTSIMPPVATSESRGRTRYCSLYLCVRTCKRDLKLINFYTVKSKANNFVKFLYSSSPPELSSGSCIEDLRLARHGNLPAQ